MFRDVTPTILQGNCPGNAREMEMMKKEEKGKDGWTEVNKMKNKQRSKKQRDEGCEPLA